MSELSQKVWNEPWLVWLSKLSAGLQTKSLHIRSWSGHMLGLRARFPVGGV